MLKSKLSQLFCLLLIFFGLFKSTNVLGQDASSYNMSLVKVIDQKKTHKVSVILKVTPTIEDYTLILSGKIEYSFGRKVLKSNVQNDAKLKINIYGDDFYNKVPEYFTPVKDQIKMEENEILLVFTFSKVKGKGLSEGYLKYGLWESDHPDIRNEQIFEFGPQDIVTY